VCCFFHSARATYSPNMLLKATYLYETNKRRKAGRGAGRHSQRSGIPSLLSGSCRAVLGIVPAHKIKEGHVHTGEADTQDPRRIIHLSHHAA